MRNASTRRAFTLVELLVVIGIIAILISVLLPTLSRARKAARSAQCLSNVRQLGMAFLMYTNTYRRSIPFYQNSEEQGLWIGQLRGVYSRIDASRTCPEAWEPFNTTTPTERTGTAFNCWGPATGAAFIGTQTGSYGFNGWLYWFNTATTPSRGAPVAAPALPFTLGYPDPQRDWFKVPFAKRGAEIPVFGDSVWVDGWPRPDDGVPLNLNVGMYITSGNTGIPDQNFDTTSGKGGRHLGRWGIARHQRGINMVFADGHAAPVPLRELWGLYWQPRWRTPMPLPKVP
ncbi:MAG: hypothetical protein QOF78_2267 [Phycisphaerales bacterium]|jgi:prepilin-type N-terminal cleavage/methylation domain-containing protein/prepilin-type processing-associated H-X9-DG protein|nr:hypothetical protein [Phycisphaerales bacterium]